MNAIALAEPPSNEELAVQARGGCTASFGELVRRFQVPLLQFLRQRVAGYEDAEDLLQESFVRAYRNLHRYDERWRFSTWLFTIAHRLGMNRRKHSPPSESVAALDLVPSLHEEPPAIAIQAEDRARLWSLAAAVLHRDQVAALWLYYVEEMSLAEVGKVLGRSQMTVKMLLFRARKKLMPKVRELVEPSGRDMPGNAAGHSPAALRLHVGPLWEFSRA